MDFESDHQPDASCDDWQRMLLEDLEEPMVADTIATRTFWETGKALRCADNADNQLSMALATYVDYLNSPRKNSLR